jgi:hypothetical protein
MRITSEGASSYGLQVNTITKELHFLCISMESNRLLTNAMKPKWQTPKELLLLLPICC